MSYTAIKLDRIGKVGVVSLNRPDVLNAIDYRMLLELQEAFDELGRDGNIRVVVLTSEGRCFSSGADLKDLKGRFGDQEHLLAFLQTFEQVVTMIEQFPKPVICAAKGLVLAGGMEITNACDILICSDDAEFGDQHINYGLLPGGGNSQRLPRLIGVRRAKELLFSGSRLSASEANMLGLANRVVPADKLFSEAMALAQQLAEHSATALARMKELVRYATQTELQIGIELELMTTARHLMGGDAAEGIRAFEERRKPKF